MPRERLVLARATVIALPIIGTALANIPAIGEQLGAVTAIFSWALPVRLPARSRIFLYELAMEGVTGLAAAEAPASDHRICRPVGAPLYAAGPIPQASAALTSPLARAGSIWLAWRCLHLGHDPAHVLHRRGAECRR